MKKLILGAALLLGACATARPGPIQIETRDVAVTHTERAVSEQDVRNTAPPAPLGARPGNASAALDLVVAKLCEYVGYAERADIMLQHAAGISPITSRVVEPVCAPRPAPPG